MSKDPFPPALAHLQSQLTALPPLLSSLHRITRGTPHAHKPTPETTSARADLQHALTDVEADLADLRASVDAAGRDPRRFGLDEGEVVRRRGAVEKIGGEIALLRKAAWGEVSSPTAGRRRRRSGLLEDGDVDSEEEEKEEGDEEEAQVQEEEAMMIAEQDEALEGVFTTVGNLRAQADEMGRELEEQGGLIDEVDVVTERVGGKLQDGLKRVEWIYRRNEERAGSCCIGVLIVALIILLVLAIVL